MAFSLPPPQSDRVSRNSGRAVHTSMIGASRDQSTMWSTTSRNAGSAQWMSSQSAISGLSSGQELEEPPDRPRRLLGRADTLADAEDLARGDG